MENRCPTCQRVTFVDHEGYDCANWPEMGIGQTSVEYRGYQIVRWNGKWAYCFDREDWKHVHSPVVAFGQIDLKLHNEGRKE